MIEVRAYVMEAEFAARTLLPMGAVIQGDYAFRDHIYQPKMKEKFDAFEEAVNFLGHSYIEIFNFQRQGIEYKLDD